MPSTLVLAKSSQLGDQVLQPADAFAMNGKKKSSHSKIILKLMSENAEQEGMSPLQCLLVVNDVVFGITDSFLLRMYQRILGPRLPP